MIAGTLEIQMLANMARLSEDMAKAKGMIGTVEAAAKSLNAVLGTLGVALGSASMLMLIKGSIDAANHLDDLSKSTNLTIDELAGLSVLAKQNGTDLDGLAKAIDRMSVAMGKSPDKFRQLGITAKDPLEALKQFADIFKILPDVQQRNALAQAVYNKSWAEMAPILSLGGQRIGEVIEKGSQLSGVTEEIAQQANSFNSKWVELTGTGGLFTRQVGPMLPLLNTLAQEMLDAGKKADGMENSFTPLKDTLQVLAIVYANLAFMAKTAGNEIAGTAAQVATIAAGPGGLDRAAAIRKAMFEDAAKAQADLDAFEKKIMGASLTGKAPPGAPGADPAAAAAAAAKAKEFLRDDYAARVAVIKIGGEAYAEAIRVSNQLADLAMKEGGIDNQRTREALLLEQQTNTSDQIFDLMQRQEKIKKLSQQGDQTPDKVKAAAAATAEIEKLNAKLLASETITQAQIRAARTVTAQQQAAEYNAFIDSQVAIGQSISDSFKTQAQIENDAYAKKLVALDLYLQSADVLDSVARQRREQLATEHQANLGDISAQGKMEAFKFDQMTDMQQLSYLTNFATTTTAAAAAHSKKMFELNKLAGEANIIVSTAVGAMKAWELGPILGPIMAGLVVAAGAVNLQAVRNSQFTGGGVAPSVGAAAGGATPTFQTNAPISQASSASSQTVINLNVTGVVTQNVIDQMIEQLRTTIGNSDAIIIPQGSRQALDLAAAAA